MHEGNPTTTANTRKSEGHTRHPTGGQHLRSRRAQVDAAGPLAKNDDAHEEIVCSIARLVTPFRQGTELGINEALITEKSGG